MAAAALIGLAITAGSAAASGVMGYVNARQQAQAAEQQAQWQQAVATQNEAMDRSVGAYNAQAAVQQAAAEETRLRRDRARRTATATATFLASGLTLAGSPMDVLADEARETEEQALLVRYGGQVQANQARLAGAIGGYRSQLSGIASGYEGAVAAQHYRAQGLGSLIGGLGSAAGTTIAGPLGGGWSGYGGAVSVADDFGSGGMVLT